MVMDQLSRLAIEELSLKKIVPLPDPMEVEKLVRKYLGSEDGGFGTPFSGVFAELAKIERNNDHLEEMLEIQVNQMRAVDSAKDGIVLENQNSDEEEVELDDEATVRMRKILASELGQNYINM